MRMSLRGFIFAYLKQKAIVTLAMENGDIIFEGAIKKLDMNTVSGMYVKEICGLGSLSDIIITLTPFEEG